MTSNTKKETIMKLYIITSLNYEYPLDKYFFDTVIIFVVI